jgi:hypothetical protein
MDNEWPPREDLNICLHFDEETKDLIKALTDLVKSVTVSGSPLHLVLTPQPPQPNEKE